MDDLALAAEKCPHINVCAQSSFLNAHYANIHVMMCRKMPSFRPSVGLLLNKALYPSHLLLFFVALKL